MLKHRQKLSNVQPIVGGGGGGAELHPRSPSIDITSVFNPAPGDLSRDGSGGQDAERLFEEAFPMPSTSNSNSKGEKLVSPLIKLLSSPSLPSTNTASPTLQHSLPTATAQAQGGANVDAKMRKRESGGGGLRELELVKRRLSLESIASNSSETAMVEGEGEVLTDEEKFEDALEEEEVEEIVRFSLSLLSTHHRQTLIQGRDGQISPIMLPTTMSTPPPRKRFLVSSSRSTTLPLETSATLSLGLGLGIDLSSPPPSMLSPESAKVRAGGGVERLQGPLEFDEVKEELSGLGMGLGLGPAMGMGDGQGLRGLGLGFGEVVGESLGKREEEDE